MPMNRRSRFAVARGQEGLAATGGEVGVERVNRLAEGRLLGDDAQAGEVVAVDEAGVVERGGIAVRQAAVRGGDHDRAPYL